MARFSSDGTQIVCVSGTIGAQRFWRGELVLYNMRTGRTTRLTDDPAMKIDPCFSPDGRWIAYLEEGPGPSNRLLQVIRADGTGKKRTLIGPGHVLRNPDWGP